MTSVAMVIPVGPDRLENLLATLDSIEPFAHRLSSVVLAFDGYAPARAYIPRWAHGIDLPIRHAPGMEQPRNVGVRNLDAAAEYVWFLDSDVILEPDALDHVEAAIAAAPTPRVICLPYDWGGPGIRVMVPRRDVALEMDDPRWDMFDRYPPGHVLFNDLSAGLACFSGNLVWPRAEFERIGGFWSELHHGRCEDGELGLRAVAMQVGISFAAGARGMHLWHPRNQDLAIERNRRDVPMLNARHPWVERGAVFLSDRDGKAFDVQCPGCGERIHTLQWWAHAPACGVSGCLPVDPS